MEKRLLFIFLVVIITVSYSIYQKNLLHTNLNDNSSEAILTKLPLSKFKDLKNNDFDLKRHLASNTKIVFIHFWGTWCGPCDAELPDLVSFAKKFENNDEIQFILIAVNDDPLKVKKRIQNIKNTNLTWLLDNDNIYKKSFGSVRVPESYIFNSNDQFLKKFVGPQDWTRDHYFQLFQEFLQLNINKL